MVSAKSVEDQLKKIGFNKRWNNPETSELANILLPDEEVFECVNGWYEGGFALLCATNVRVLLIDKKPLKYLTIEDVRFDTINQIDYSHRLSKANICITAGLKSLKFRSYNQPRLRQLISHVQHRMAELKSVEQAEMAKNEGNLQALDQQLKAYLLSQYEQHQSLNRLKQTTELTPKASTELNALASVKVEQPVAQSEFSVGPTNVPELAENVSQDQLYEDGLKEVFGKYDKALVSSPVTSDPSKDKPVAPVLKFDQEVYGDMHPLKIAYSKLPMILSRRRRLTTASTI